MPNLLAVLHWLLVKTDLFPSFLPKVSFHYDQRSYAELTAARRLGFSLYRLAIRVPVITVYLLI